MQLLPSTRPTAADSQRSSKPADRLDRLFLSSYLPRPALKHLCSSKSWASKHFTNGVTEELKYPGSASVPVVYRPRCIETGEVLFMKGDIHFATGNQNKLNEVAAFSGPTVSALVSRQVASRACLEMNVLCIQVVAILEAGRPLPWTVKSADVDLPELQVHPSYAYTASFCACNNVFMPGRDCCKMLFEYGHHAAARFAA